MLAAWTEKSRVLDTAVPAKSALTVKVAAPMLDTDAGEIETDAIPLALVNAVPGVRSAMDEPSMVNVNALFATGLPSASVNVACTE
jgi:hypothetical protein